MTKISDFVDLEWKKESQVRLVTLFILCQSESLHLYLI